MKTNAAILWGVNEDWSIEDVELDPPQAGEVLVSFEATGVCHSDHHLRTGDMPKPEPRCRARVSLAAASRPDGVLR